MKKQFNNEENLVWEQKASPLLLTLTLPDLKGLKKLFNLGHFTTIVIFENENQAKWVFRKEECNLIGSKIVDILKNSTYKNNFREAIASSSEKLLKKINIIENDKKLSSMSLNDAVKEYKKFTKCFYDYFKYSVLVEPIEWYTEDVLNKYINNMSITLDEKKEMIQYLLKIEEDSFATKIVIDLNKCAIKLDKFLKENKNILNYSDSKLLAKTIIDNDFKSLSYQELLTSLNNHLKLYYWKHNNYYQTQKLNIKDILEELLENIYQVNADFKTYENNILEMEENKKEEIRKKRYFEKLLPQYLQDIVKISNEFGGQLGDKRKEMVMKSLGALDKILNVIASRTKYSLENIHMLIPHEMDDFTLNYKNYEERFIRRRNGLLIYHTDLPLLDEITYQEKNENILNWKVALMNEPLVVEEKQVSEILEKLNKYYNLFNYNLFEKNNLKGTIVYKDKGKTRIRGKVKIIKDPKKEKINKDEILVATSTTPDFINAIHNAQAVITDWGGLTSHAAIITRELKKPCIVGTNYATSILNDNDEVEIDLENGVVIILRKKGE